MEEIVTALRNMNPWWAGKPALKNEIIERAVQKDVIDSLKLRQIKDILGVRRSGKTTLLYLIIDELIHRKVKPSKIFFLTFDEINTSTATFEEIGKAIAQIEPDPEYLFLDEAQEKNGWERWVKQLYDSGMFRQIFVSGSNASLLSKDVGRLLSGRHITTIIYPFSFREFLAANGWKDFSRAYLLSEKNRLLHFLSIYLKNGGFPESVGRDEQSAARILSNTYNDIILRDIAARHRIEKAKIDMLAKYLLTNIAKEYSYNSLARNIGLNIETVESYLGYLKESFLLFSLDIFSYKLKSQYKQNKKIYAVDTGLRNSVSFRFSEDIGRLYENAVFLELKRREKEVFYWKGKGEADFLVKEGLKVTELIQVCVNISGRQTKDREVKSLAEAAKSFRLKECKIITEDYRGEEMIEGIKLVFMPLWMWILDL